LRKRAEDKYGDREDDVGRPGGFRNRPIPTAQAPVTAKVIVRPLPRVRRPISEPMNTHTPNTATDGLNKSAVCPTPKSLRKLVAAEYPRYRFGYGYHENELRRAYKKAPR